ncbi:MAG: ABC transporter transmembrane domain-containing protein [Deltaproteobacteria bacterium]|nr:ABC transporter transmembrane domain-containing protein [Deltaproteobacteria bacterium]
MEGRRIPLDRLTWQRWRRATWRFVRSEVGGRARALFLALLALLVAINGLNVVNSYVGRDFMTAIEARSKSGFLFEALLYVGVFAASTVAAVIYSFCEQRLGLLWRAWLTRGLIERYLHDDTYYWLREHDELPNPDQRIAEDVRTFTATTLSLLLILLNATFTIVAFSGVLWSISPLLFGTAVAYAALGSGLTVLFGRPLIWLNYQQSDREADLRASLVHVRENAESVALLHREGRLGARLGKRVDALVANTRRIIAVNRNLGFFTTGYNYLIQIIPVLIVAPLFIGGHVEFGVITQSSMAFSTLIGAFSLIVTQFQQISSYAVVLARLGVFAESVEEVAADGARGIVHDDGGDGIAWQELTLRSPHDGTVLLAGLSASVRSGTRVLVTGPNEAARFALFRATARLWNAGEGRIVRPPPGTILFVPERPYLPPGTLREALVQTGQEQAISDARIAEVLRALGVDGVFARSGGLDAEQDWDDLLSLGEQQLLGFARIVLAKPRFAVLDRPATLLPRELVERTCALLAESAITVVTFERDAALAAHHDAQLEIGEGGRWVWRPLAQASRSA